MTNYLSPSDYGIVSTFTITITFFSIFIGLGTSGAILSNYYRITKEELKVYMFIVLTIIVTTSILALLSVVIFEDIIKKYVSIDILWILIAIILSLADKITTINLKLWVMEKRAFSFTIYQLSQTIISTLTILILVIYFREGWRSYLIGYSSVFIFYMLISILFLVKRDYIKVSFSREFFYDSLKFGLPLILHSISNWVRGGVDRILLTTLISVSATGIYFIGYQFGIAISLFVGAINKSINQYIFKFLSSEPSDIEKKSFVKKLYLLFLSIFFIAIIYSIIIEKIFPYIIDSRFLEAKDYILPLSIAFAFQGMYAILTNVIFYEKRTLEFSKITFYSSFLHLLLLYILILKYNIIGAVYASLISYILIFILIWVLSNRIYPLPWNLLKK